MKYTAVQSLAWGNAEHTSVNAVVTFDKIGAVPFSASADDPEAHGQEIFAKAVAGQFGAVAAYVAPVQDNSVPQSVTPLQARKALRQAGLKAQVDAYVATLSDEAREEWEYCISVERNNGLVNDAATALGMTEDQKDDLFRLAATL